MTSLFPEITDNVPGFYTKGLRSARRICTIPDFNYLIQEAVGDGIEKRRQHRKHTYTTRESHPSWTKWLRTSKVMRPRKGRSFGGDWLKIYVCSIKVTCRLID